MQSKRNSFIETIVGTLIGFIVSLILTMIVLPLHGLQPTTFDSISITAIFTVASIIRGYYVRRLFNYINFKAIL